METELTERREARLKSYDYGKTGVYFVTVCVKERRDLLSEIIVEDETNVSPVGDGALDVPKNHADVPKNETTFQRSKTKCDAVGDGALDVPPSADVPPTAVSTSHITTKLTEIGKIVEKNLLSSEKIPGVKIDKYVIMPDHFHVIIILESVSRKGGTSGGRPLRTTDDTVKQIQSIVTSAERELRRPADDNRNVSRANEMLPHIISTFKRFCAKEIGEDIFQRSYYDHIIRDREDYEIRRKYIYDNPAKRYFERKNGK